MGDIINIDDLYVGGEAIEAAYVGNELVWDSGGGFYPHYMSHLSAIDGLYSGFNYSNVYVVGNELIVGYLAKKHHFTAMSEGSQIFRVARMNLETKQITETDAVVGMGYCGSVYYNGVYYIFDSFRNRYTTTDWVTFTKSTYTLPNRMSEPYYITVGDNGRFISTISYAVKGAMIYSDDLGLTWTRATGGNSAYCDHGGTCKVGNTLVAYCQDKTGSGPTDDTSRRWVLTSTDNGTTWSDALCTDPDLLRCGGSHASGEFCNIGEDWYYLTGNRLQWTDDKNHIHLGTIQLFKGTAQDVINGSMHLYKIIDDLNTGCTSITISNNTTWTDTGNLGMATDGSKLYCVYMRPLFHLSQASYYDISNCMVALSIVDSERKGGLSDDYYNRNWQSDLEAELLLKDTTHDFYIYADDVTPITNYFGTIYTKSLYNRMVPGYVQPSQNIKIPFINYFEICFIGRLRETIPIGQSNYAMAYIGANVDGEETCVTGTTNSVYYNKTDGTGGAASISGIFNQDLYFKLKYENGVISATLNDIEIKNVKSRFYSSYNTDEDTILFRCLELAEKITLNDTSRGGMVKHLWIDADGDWSGIAGYTVSNLLTNITSSNTDELIEKDSYYTAVLTPTARYEIKTISVIMGGTDITASAYNGGVITINEVTGNLTITASAAERVTLLSISAVYNQSGVVYDTDPLNSLKTDLVVTATFSDSSTQVIPDSDYSLSGTLTAGVSTITVSYADKTTTFTVNVTAQPSLYHLTNGVYYDAEVPSVATITNGKHVKLEFNKTVSSSFFINLTAGTWSSSGSVVNNLPTWFTIPAGSATFYIENVTNSNATSFEMNLRKANASSSANFGSGGGAHASGFTKTASNTADVDVSCIFVYFPSGVTSGSVIEFDVGFTVGAVEYIAPGMYPLTDRTFNISADSRTLKLEISNNRHVKLEVLVTTGGAKAVNVKDGLMGTVQASIDNKPSWFIIPNGVSTELTLSNIINNGITFSGNFRIANASSAGGYAISSSEHTSDVVITKTLTSAQDVSCLYIYMPNKETTGDSVEFDVRFTVDGVKYI